VKVALDVRYDHARATAAAVLFERWQDSEPVDVVRHLSTVPSGYRAGSFYLRELPCLLALLETCGRRFGAIVVDGYVDLQPDVGKGLGRHLFEALPYPASVVGVAKSSLRVAERFVPLERGDSRRPLYVSAAGLSLERAAAIVRAMHGRHRIPTLLKHADRASRGTLGA
jgi:deoxyribonuclease V